MSLIVDAPRRKRLRVPAVVGLPWQIFLRYAGAHMTMHLDGFPVIGPDDRTVGFVDRIRYAGHRIHVDGWARAREVALISPDATRAVVPSIPRPDVTAELGLEPGAAPGWSVSMPWAPQDHGLRFTCADGTTLDIPLPAFTEGDRRAALRDTAWPFVKAATRATPAALRWITRRDIAARSRVRDLLGLGPAQIDTTRIDPAVLQPAPPDPASTRPICIVLPVYNAFDLLQEALDRVLRHTDLPWHLVAIEDCSPDDRVRPWLRAWAAARPEGQVTLLENASNLGFIGSVNRGLAVAGARGEDVVLLNSDALVPEGWSSRLMAPLHDPRVATVTPMSNDAEIFTQPRLCIRHDVAPGAADTIDARARTLSAPVPVEAPTGVGFCMAMSRRFLDRIPRLDTAFGRGYGEEVDWCQRARALGGRNVAQPRLFVEHRGGQSFGNEKLAMIARAGRVITERYPRYDAEVQAFIARDPLATTRLALGIAELGADPRPVPIYLAHAMGGGAETVQRGLIAEDVTGRGGALVLRVGGVARWRLELHGPDRMAAGETDLFEDIEALLSPLGNRHVIYGCGVGERDPVALPDRLIDLADGGRLTVLMNDYFPLGPSFNLMDGDGVFRGVPEATSTDPAHLYRASGGAEISLTEWRARWGRLMARAAEIRVFSTSGRDIVAAAYPEAAARITVRPHALPHAIPRLAAPEGPPVIGVLGNIDPVKGARVLSRLSEVIVARGGARLVLLGNIAPGHALAGDAIVHGTYAIEDLPDLVARYGVDRWLIPSICPETFSFTTHEALATGLPVHAFALGAQGEAVRSATALGAPGGLLNLDATPEAWLDAML
ncbi:glycosyltransferase [uncultured Jannaschia sp.]|uniref:glycosyltransferase n=1 Tax=uncultured Jannaschia sp. TaxID=293347 RepID=UPI00261FC6AC|nr:glycosyltransferase [uncultured Jannaschia sp.]